MRHPVQQPASNLFLQNDPLQQEQAADIEAWVMLEIDLGGEGGMAVSSGHRDVSEQHMCT